MPYCMYQRALVWHVRKAVAYMTWEPVTDTYMACIPVKLPQYFVFVSTGWGRLCTATTECIRLPPLLLVASSRQPYGRRSVCAQAQGRKAQSSKKAISQGPASITAPLKVLHALLGHASCTLRGPTPQRSLTTLSMSLRLSDAASQVSHLNSCQNHQ